VSQRPRFLDRLAGAGNDFDRLAGVLGIVVGAGGLLYSITFVAYLSSGSRGTAEAASLFLMLGGVAVMPVLVAVYQRLREVDLGIAATALLLGVVGAAAAAIHGAYDLANFVNPPSRLPVDAPNPADPRGLGTFALTGVALLLIGLLVRRGGALSRPFGVLALVAGGLFVYVYVGRLTILDPKNPAVLIPAVLSGFIVNPVVYVWLGLSLLGMEPSVRLRRAVGAGTPEAPSAPSPSQAQPGPAATPTEPIEGRPPRSEPTEPLP
jgi:hypothetical protein